MNPRVPIDPSNAFPVVATLVALDAWQRDPTASRLSELREALGAVTKAAGAQGAYLEIDAPPLPPLRTGVGTLLEGPGAGGRTVSIHPLQPEDGGASLGSLWLDADLPAAEIAARALELAVNLSWSRATVR